MTTIQDCLNRVSFFIQKEKFALLLLFTLPGFLGAQKTPRTYIANKTNDTILINGRADEEAWQKAHYSKIFIDIEGEKKPKYDTRIKMMWDDENLYVFAQMQEPHVWSTLKQRDTIIFYNNDFEIFIDPDGDTHNYYEFEMNALNTVWDLFLSKPYRNGGTILGGWDFKGLRSAVDIQGTLNDPSDIDIGWSIEVAIPWSFVTAPGGRTKIPQNEYWRINFSRVNWDFDINNGSYSRKKDKETGVFSQEYNWVWSPQGVINMHEPEHWGYVYFAAEEVGPQATFEIPKDEYIKWYLYELYRTYAMQPSNEGAILKSKEIQGNRIVPKLEKYKYGWMIWILSPFTNHILSVTKEGKFETHKN